jgi:hypothetical protein
MSLLQEMEKYGLADCEFNRNLTRINRLIKIYLPIFNEQQIMEGDEDLCITIEQAPSSSVFINWLRQCDDRRSELYYLLMRV